MPRVLNAYLALAILAAPTLARAESSTLPVISFASADEGRAVLTARDDFVTRLSPFDRAARLKTNRDVSEQEYLAFVSKNVLEWEADEKAVVQSAWAALTPRLSQFSLPLPKTILFIKTTGAEEGDAEYTRANAIILPQSALAASHRANLPGTIAHELFHVLSRNAPDLRDRLYAVIGFQPCGEIPFPPELASRKITNPDAPKNDHCIRLQQGQSQIWAIPILFSTSDRYDPAKGGEFFAYLAFRLLVVQKTGAQATYDPSKITLLDVNQVQGFYEQVGRNTEYIIHPEEILADNFSFMMIGKPNLPSPQIQQKLAATLSLAIQRPAASTTRVPVFEREGVRARLGGFQAVGARIGLRREMNAPEVEVGLGEFDANGPLAVFQDADMRHATFLLLARHAVDQQDALPFLDAHANPKGATISVH